MPAKNRTKIDASGREYTEVPPIAPIRHLKRKSEPGWREINRKQLIDIALAKKSYAKRKAEYRRIAKENLLFSEGLPMALAKSTNERLSKQVQRGDLNYLREDQTPTQTMPNEALGENLSDRWKMQKRISEMEESEEPLIDQAGLLPYTERPAYSVGEYLVKKAPFRPSKRQMAKYEKGEITYHELMRPERILKGATDILSPQDAKGVAEVAVLGGVFKGVKAAYKGGKRLMTNIPMTESYDISRKLKDIVNAPFKNKLYAMKYDVPVSPSVPLGTKSTRMDRLRKQLEGTLDEKDRGDLGYIAYELMHNKRRSDAAKELVERAITNAQKNDAQKMVDKIEFDHFISIQDYFLRRGLKMPSTPEAFNNPKFLNMFPEYKPVAKEWKRMMSNIMEYEMKDPNTGKMIPYASFKELPHDLKESLLHAGYGSSTTKGYGPFGGYSVGKTSREVPGMPSGMKEERMFYKDVSDFNVDLGGSLKRGFDHIRKNWRPFKKPEWGVEGTKSVNKSFMDILHEKKPYSSTDIQYGASYGGDILRGVVDKMMKPVTWQGEYAMGTMGSKYNYPLQLGKGGQASRTVRVFTKKTMYKIRGESGFGMRKTSGGGRFINTDKEMIEWSLKSPNSSGYMEGGYKNMRLSRDKNKTFRLTQWVEPSKKEAKWSKDIMDFEKALEEYKYTGVKRFEHKAPKKYER